MEQMNWTPELNDRNQMMNSTMGDIPIISREPRRKAKSKLLVGTGKRSPYNSKKNLVICPKI